MLGVVVLVLLGYGIGLIVGGGADTYKVIGAVAVLCGLGFGLAVWWLRDIERGHISRDR